MIVLFKWQSCFYRTTKNEATREEVAEANTQDNQWRVTPISKMKYVDSKSASNGKHGIVIIEKWKTMLGQTLYIKSFHPNVSQPQLRQHSDQIQLYQQPSLFDMASQLQAKSVVNLDVRPQAIELEQQSVLVQKTSRQFVLASGAIVDLPSSPKFKTNITVGKLLKIINCLMADKKLANLSQNNLMLTN